MLFIERFNTKYYEDKYPEAAKAVKDGEFANLEDHFARKGAAEGYNPNPWFDTKLYKSENHDVADALKAGKFPGVNVFQHFVQHGVYEDRPVPSHLFDGFDAAKYLEANKDVKEHLNNKTLGEIKDAQAHFLIFGAEEMIKGKRALSGISSDDLTKIAKAMGFTYTPPGEGDGGEPGHETGGGDGIDGKTYSLTEKADEYKGTDKNDLFKAVIDTDNGTASTFTSTDILDGGGEAGGDGDVLDLKVAGKEPGKLPYASVRNIETIRVRDVTTNTDDTKPSVYDLSLIDGEKNVVDYKGHAKNVKYTNVDDNATMVISGYAKRDTAAAKDGFRTVSFGTEGDDNPAKLRLEHVSGRGNNLTITSSNPSLVMTAADGLNVLNELSLRSDTKTWNIDGDGKVQINAVKASGLEAVDASKNKGGVNLDLHSASAVTKVTGGSGDDLVYVGKQFTEKDEKVDGGAGNDTLFFEGSADISFAKEKDFSDHYSGFESIGLAGDGGKINLAHVNMPFVFDPNKGSKDVTATVIAPANIDNVDITVYAPREHAAQLNLGFDGSPDAGANNRKATVNIVDHGATGSETPHKQVLTFDKVTSQKDVHLKSWTLELKGVDKVEKLIFGPGINFDSSTVTGDDKDSNIVVLTSTSTVYDGGKGNDVLEMNTTSKDVFRFKAGDSSYSWGKDDKGNAVASSDTIYFSGTSHTDDAVQFETALSINKVDKPTAGHASIEDKHGEAKFDTKDKTIDQKLEAIAKSIGSSDKGSFAWFKDDDSATDSHYTYLYISDGVDGFDHDSDVVVKLAVGTLGSHQSVGFDFQPGHDHYLTVH